MLDRKKEDIERFYKEDCPFVPNLEKLKREPSKGIESFLERNEAECRKRELKMQQLALCCKNDMELKYHHPARAASR